METQRDWALSPHRARGVFHQTHENVSACLRAAEGCDFRSRARPIKETFLETLHLICYFIGAE